MFGLIAGRIMGSKLGLLAVAAVLVIAAYNAGSLLGYQRGFSRAQLEQIAADAELYQKTIREIQNESIDLTDGVAVDCLLRRLAGQPTGDGCGDL